VVTSIGKRAPAAAFNLDLSAWNLSAVTYTRSMFRCASGSTTTSLPRTSRWSLAYWHGGMGAVSGSGFRLEPRHAQWEAG
jgi:hypothetical protein